MATAYVHVGHGKTGTTALQRWLFENSELLSERNMLYVRSGRVGVAHHGLAPLRGVIPGRALEALVRESNQHSASDLVISSEYLYYAQPPTLVALGEALKDRSIAIILYVRPQLALIASTFLQWVKVGHDYGEGPEHFYRRHRRSFQFELAVAKFRDQLPDARVVARLYRGTIGGGTPGDFCRALGIPFDGTTPTASENPSLPAPLWEVVGVMDRHGITGEARADIVSALVSAKVAPHHAGRNLFSEETMSEIVRFYAPGNERLTEYFADPSDARDFLDAAARIELTATPQ